MRRLNYERKDLGFSFALTTFVMIAAALLLGFIFGAETGGWKFWTMQALYTALIGASAILYAVLFKTNFASATRLNVKPRVAHALWGCGAVVFLVVCMSQINNLFLDLIELTGLTRPSVELEDNLAGLIICACILPAFAEEVVFRGTVAQSLYESKNKLGALAISGALFAVFHANPAQTLHQFVLGAFLTLLVFRSGSLWTSVIVHLFNNAFVVAMSYTPLGADEFWNLKTNTKVALPLLIVGIVGFALCVFGYIKTTKSCWGKREAVAEERSENDEAPQEEQSQKPILSDYRKSSDATLYVALFVCLVLWLAQLFV